MQYTEKDIEFLGRQVASGRYVTKGVWVLSMLCALLVGVGIGFAVSGSSGQGEIRQPLGSNGANQLNQPSPQVLEAIIQAEKAANQDPSKKESWVLLGNLYFDARNPSKAIESYNKALAIDPLMKDILVDCGVMYRAQMQYEKALEYFNRALAIDPAHQFALFNIGVVLHNDLKKDPEALAVWDKVVKLNPQFKTPDGRLLSDVIKDHGTPN